MIHKWQLHEAKNKLSHLIDAAEQGEIQYITRRGRQAAVLIGMDTYSKLTKDTVSFKDFLLTGPKIEDIDISRPQGKAREVEL